MKVLQANNTPKSKWQKDEVLFLYNKQLICFNSGDSDLYSFMGGWNRQRNATGKSIRDGNVG